MNKLIGVLKSIPDPRQPWKVKHTLWEILVICILAVTANANSSYEIHTFATFREEWLRKFLPLKYGIPSRLTFERVLRILNLKQFNAAFMKIMQYVQAASHGAVVAIDGKACHHGEGHGVLYMVSAWCARNGMTLGQVKTQEKSNEITAIPELLALLDIKGATVTIDAIGCQREIVNRIVTKNKANYAIALKQNQPAMYEAFALYAKDCLSDPLLSHAYTFKETVEKAHGRIEKRRYFLFHDLTWFPSRKDWKNLSSFLLVQSTRQIKGREPSTESRYYITSLTCVDEAANAVRAHWGIENSLHWVLDVVFKEDDWKTKAPSAAANLAILRRLTANILKAHPAQETTPIKRYICSLDLDFLQSVISNPLIFS